MEEGLRDAVERKEKLLLVFLKPKIRSGTHSYLFVEEMEASCQVRQVKRSARDKTYQQQGRAQGGLNKTKH